jgi:hypothetical protein
MRIEQDQHEARETVHMFSTFDGTLFQDSIQFEVLLTLDEECLWQHGTITVFIKNSGKSDALIEEVSINSEQIQASEWMCVPSAIVERNGGTVTMTIAYSWEPNETCNFLVSPNFGEDLDFHETAPQSDEEEPPPSPYEKLEMTACDWTWGVAGSRTVKVTVKNSGTKDVTVNHVEINHVRISTTAVSPEPPFTFITGAFIDIIITYDYTNGSSYDVAVVTSTGQEFTDHFVGGQDENGHTVPSAANLGVMAVQKYNATAYLIDVKNFGTASAAVESIRIAGSAGNTGWQSLPDGYALIPAGASRTLDTGNVDVDFPVGATVTVSVRTTTPSELSNTLTIEG